MPCLEYFKKQQAMNQDHQVSPQWLVEQICHHGQILPFDCRSSTEYHHLHVRDAINVVVPPSILMLRRITDGKLTVSSLIKDIESREKFMRLNQTHIIVLYNKGGEESVEVLTTLLRRLEQDGCRAVYLQGGFESFQAQFPEWCEAEGQEINPVESEILGLETLRITAPSDGADSDQDRCDSGFTKDSASPSDTPFPVEILPYLFLGNAENSQDLQALKKHRIVYILNVTPDLPNVFEDKGLGFHYMHIPIQDHWSQNLGSFFTKAITFIDEARQRKKGVLVHCLAGISRSVTITLAYLMQKMNMPLNDAYDFVRQRKTNISPNFNFLGQLMDFERQLNLTPCCFMCQGAPCRCQTFHFMSPTQTTPDSGIDIDRWS
ncbi:dual specificity protein phosphatase 7-like [Limulus polyphemus]|uniref:protein-tyrosine-phosphatase n=1 Tax=Limulus polyphemus TaxID=6850 RepID=A0ABM1B0U0_LIMPO|nr:dual specificity protein phosphatase 7-like [Limulus polyphemus]